MNDILEICNILKNNGIIPVNNPWRNTPQVWLTSKFTAFEIEPKYLDLSIDFLEKVFKKVEVNQMQNKNYLIKGENLKDKYRTSLPH